MTIRVPQRGDKRSLMETVERNAAQSFTQHKLKRASDLTARSLALADCRKHLGLEDAPLRIEYFDISHVQGTNVVASMVVFEDGLPRTQRIPALRDAHGAAATPTGSPRSVSRRFARYLDEQVADGADAGLANDADSVPPGDWPTARVAARPSRIDPATGRPRKFSYPPNLLVVNGGAPQVTAARAALDELGIDDVALVGLAKRLEEVWLPGPIASGDPAANVRGSVPTAAGARRGAPVRDHLPSAEAIEGHDYVPVGRHRRTRRDPQEGAARPLRIAAATAGRVGR